MERLPIVEQYFHYSCRRWSKKCTVEHSLDTIHPPPITGNLIRKGDSIHHEDVDEYNLRKQYDFFVKLVHYWNEPTTRSAEVANGNVEQVKELREFFKSNGIEYFGWRKNNTNS